MHACVQRHHKHNSSDYNSLQAKELGVRSVIIDGPDSWSQSLKADGTIEQFIGLDFSDADTVFDRCLAAILKVKKVHVRFDHAVLHWQAQEDLGRCGFV